MIPILVPLLLVSAAAGSESVVPTLVAGDLVRLQPCAGTLVVGEWRAASADSFRIAMDDGTNSAYSIRETCSLDVQVSHAGSWMKTGLLLGTTVGVAAGAVLAWRESDPDFDVFPLYLGVIGGGGAGLVGAVLGALVPRWEPVTIPAGRGQTEPPKDGEAWES